MVLALVALLCLSACQTKIQVGVDIAADGSGTVTVSAHLDHDASVHSQEVRIADLVASGWTVVGPTPAADGGVDFTATKRFANPAQAQVVVSELSGPAGPFRGLVVASHRSFFETTTSFEGTVDLTCGVNCFSDPQLQQALGAADLGIDPAKLQADAGIILNRLFEFQIAARLPGTVQSSNAPSQVGNGALWKAQLGQKAVLVATSHAWNVAHIVLAAAAAALAAAGAIVGVVLLAKRPGRRRRRLKAVATAA